MGKKIDIADRLRDMYGKRYTSIRADWVQKQCNEGAREIDALRAELSRLTLAAAESQREVERLRGEVSEYKGSCEIWMRINDQKGDDLRTVEAERDKYRAALERLILLRNYKDRCGKDNYYTSEQCEAWQQAKEALADS